MPTDAATQRDQIDTAVDAALVRLYAAIDGTKDEVSKAKAVLVIPGVRSAGLLIGFTYGRGALRNGTRTDGYYLATGTAVGLLAGAQSGDLFLLFRTDAALAKFRSSSGWTAGVDASVALVSDGKSGRLDTEDARRDVVGYALTNAGLMANLSIEGTKFAKISSL